MARRMTGAKLAQLVLANRWSRARYENLCETAEGIGAACVWREILKALADGDIPGRVRLGEDVDHSRSLASWMGLATDRKEGVIEAVLPLLGRARLLTVSDEEIAVPVAILDASESDRVANSPGRRPKGLSDEEWAGRLRAHQAARASQRQREGLLAGQASMPLPLRGGRDRHSDADASDIARDIPPDFRGDFPSDFREGYISEEIAISAPISVAPDIGGSRVDSPLDSAAAAAAVEERVESALYQQQQQQQPDSQHRADARDDILAEIGSEYIREEITPGNRADISSGISASLVAELVVSREAEEIAAEFLRAMEFKPDKAAEAPDEVQRLLDKGALREDLMAELERAVERKRQGAHIVSMGWFAKQVLNRVKARRLREMPASAPSVGVAPVASEMDELHPAIDSHQAWTTASPTMRRALSRALTTWGMADSERARRLHAVYRFNRPVWDLFVAVHPEGWDVIGEEPPGEAARAASG